MSMRPPTSASGAQRGVALVVVLILLLIMTLLGLASLRGTLLEERMSANLYDRSLSFQAAEAAMREAELRAENLVPATDLPAAGCEAGLCAAPDPDEPDRWTVETVWTSDQSAVATTDLGDATDAPRYIIEWLPKPDPSDPTKIDGNGGWRDAPGSCTTAKVLPKPSCDDVSFRYRITVRSQVQGRAAVMLQSTYVAP